jgi:hypothetical protein
VKGKRNTVPDRLDYLPTSLAAATQELALLANPGSSWPAEARQKVVSAEKALHGLFFVVCCGRWAEGHPQAGWPAYALLQAVLVSMFAADAEPSPYMLRTNSRLNPVVMHALRVPGDMSLPMAYFVMYELDRNGWPTGDGRQGCDRWLMHPSTTPSQPAAAAHAGKRVCALSSRAWASMG